MGFVTSRSTECYETTTWEGGEQVPALGAECLVCGEENLFILVDTTLKDGTEAKHVKPVEGYTCDHNMQNGMTPLLVRTKDLWFGVWVEFGVVDDSDENFIVDPLKEEDRIR